MELLPELFDIVFGYVDIIKDRKALLFTCKKYYRQYKRLMDDVKYGVFYVKSNCNGYPMYDFEGICDSLAICKKYIKSDLIKRPIQKSAFIQMNKKNNYTMFTSRSKINPYAYHDYIGRGYIVEEFIMNKMGGILYKK